MLSNLNTTVTGVKFYFLDTKHLVLCGVFVVLQINAGVSFPCVATRVVFRFIAIKKQPCALLRPQVGSALHLSHHIYIITTKIK